MKKQGTSSDHWIDSFTTGWRRKVSRDPRLMLHNEDRETMAALIEAINVKRKTLFEFENTPFACLESEIKHADGARRTDTGAAEDAQSADERGVRKNVQGGGISLRNRTCGW